MSGPQPHHVVIIGGGFGGLEAAKALRDAPVEVTLLDRRNFHLFQPLLYQVATGGLSPGDISFPLGRILRRQRNATTILANVTDIDAACRRVVFPHGEVPYDTLVVAAGSSHSYFGNEHWETVAPGLKTLEQATRIRRKVLQAFEAAELESDREKRRAWLTFVIVGVRPRTGVKVTSIDEAGATVETGDGSQRIPAQTVIWAAGVEANPLGRILHEKTGAEIDRAGRLLVEPDCSLPGHPEIFVIGDMADYRYQGGTSLPGLAPVAMQQGRYVGKIIRKRLRGERYKPFRYTDKGTLATIGRNHAVGHFGRFGFHGVLAWLLWLFVHLMYLVGFQNRLLVAVQWAFHYFTFNRSARLIVGDDPLPGGNARQDSERRFRSARG